MFDHRVWMNQPLLWGERCRGRGLAWTPDANWFINDPLGPVPHSHDDATEIAFMAQGSLEILVGGTRRLYRAGDLLLMPPNKFHNYWFAGVETACLFVIIAPNHKTRRIRTEDFPPGAHEGDIEFANVYETDRLPCDHFFQCEKLTLAPGQAEPECILDLKDRVVYVLEGTAGVRINTLAGPLGPHRYQYIPATCPHVIRNEGVTPLTYLSFIITDPATEHGTQLHRD
ncbi:MAG: cupin domain-containing protein [Aggregatilineales bacterium]